VGNNVSIEKKKRGGEGGGGGEQCNKRRQKQDLGRGEVRERPKEDEGVVVK
jgi:hypothetical protein